MPLVEEMLTDGGVQAVATLIKVTIVCAVLGTAAVVGGTAAITSNVEVLSVEMKNITDRVIRLENEADED